MTILRCPQCQAKLTLHSKTKTGEEIEEGSLDCEQCITSYPILRSIPRFVPTDKYVHSFSVQWTLFAQTQLDRYRKLDTDNESTLTERTGFRRADLDGRVILEAGCGMGRFLDVSSRAPRTQVVGFDLSLAVESAFENLGRRPNVHIVQADIFSPPFSNQAFDIIYSIGVLHHTPSPSAAFLRLVPLLKQGGKIAIWVYPKYEWAMMSDIYRQVTTRMPWSMLLGVVRLMTKLHAMDDKMPKLLHRCADRLLPISGQSDPEARILGTFDWYSPKYQFKLADEEVLSWFRAAGLLDTQLLSFPGAVSARRR